MYEHKFIADLYQNDSVEGFYILKRAAQKKANSGSTYLDLALMDCSGSMDAKVWNYEGNLTAEDEGTVVKVRGLVGVYRNALQMTVERIRTATPGDGYDMADLIPSAPIDKEKFWEEIKGKINTMADADYKAVCLEMLRRHEKSFLEIPAAKSVHHAFLQGLMMHTGNMMKLADFLASLYPDTVDRSLLLAGTFLHDFLKEKEYVFSRLGLASDNTVEGVLLGHLVMGAEEVGEIAKQLNIPEEKSMLLRHLILSHHGEPEFGAAVRPQCAEAELLSYIDLVDSRMEIYRENLAQIEPGQFSNKIFALDKRIYRHK